jgi:hypothetical protein
MSVAAKIVFTGLAVLVGPGKNDLTPVHAFVFPNASSASHVTYIAVPQNKYNLTVTGGTKRRVSQTAALGRKFWVVEMQGDQVVLNTDPIEVKLDRIEDKYDHDAPVNATEVPSLRWLPDMRRVWPRAWPFRRFGFDAFLGSHPLAELVAARFELRAGTLHTSYMTKDVWRFTPRNGLHFRLQQAIAHEVALDFSVQRPVLEFKITSINNSQDVSVVKIERISGTDPITVLFANTRLDEIAPASAPPARCSFPEPGFNCLIANDHHPCHCVDYHFRMYYRAFGYDQPDDPPLPHRYSEGGSVVADALRVGGTNCGPVRYDP